ncbi:MAG: 4'-phosphopantetheinyl transferase superfamily protein [Verrucomicrobia bacterium]|nr:4'-phosphopantetheinyl transferase superfamily protein [Verrucomicrobiota bacterium]
MTLQTFLWPDTVALPIAEPRAVLIQISGIERSARGRKRMREVLQEVLSEWAGGPVVLDDTCLGPRVRTPIDGKRVEVSLSYAGGCGWLGICCGRSIGVDAVVIDENFDWQDVAALYLDAEDGREIRAAPNQAVAFAQRWSAHEARCKLAGMPLQEGVSPPKAPVYMTRTARIAVSVALRIQTEGHREGHASEAEHR